MKRSVILATALLLFAAPLCLCAQNAPQESAPASTTQHFYHLKFIVEELSDTGTVTNTRTYQTTVSTGPNDPSQIIKTGSRVPIVTGSYSGSGSPLPNTQFQYIDLGVSIQVQHVAEIGDALKFNLRTDVSSMAKYSEIAGVNEPVIRQNTWSSDVLVPIGKPSVVFSSDDLDTKGKMQVEVTATPVE